MRSTGSSEHVVQKMYMEMDSSKAGFPNPIGKPLSHLAINMHRNQLFLGSNLDFLDGRFVTYFDQHMRFDGTSRDRKYTTFPQENGVSLSLSNWTSDLVVCAGQEAYFGETLGAIDPNFAWKFIEYDDLS